jgi:glycosyltransferase involved in cell wall biosynthesis
MKIAYFTETFLPKIDGVVTRLTHTIKDLHAMGHETFIVAPDGGLTEYDGAEVFGVPNIRLPMYKDFRLGFPQLKIHEKLDEFAPDLIHTLTPFILGLNGMRYAKKRQLPYVTSYHLHISQYTEYYKLSFMDGLFWKMVKLSHDRAQIDLCPSVEMIHEFARNGIEDVLLWRRGVDIDFFHPAKFSGEMRNRLTGGKPESPLIVYIGRLGEEKDIYMLRHILDAFPEVRAAVIGDGPIREKLENYFSGTNTVFTGFITGEDLAQAYASADLFVFPSQTETLGLVALEAMASGTPVLAVNAGGLKDIMVEGVNGYLYTPGSIDDLVKKAEPMLREKELRDRLSKSAFEDTQKWSWRNASSELLTYYRWIVENYPKKAAESEEFTEEFAKYRLKEAES